jgi:hypothetical protein
VVLVCVEFCVRLICVVGMPRRAQVFIDLDRTPEHLEVLTDASLFRRSGLTRRGTQAVDEALAAVHPRLNLRTARTCAEHAGRAAAV